MEEPTLIEWLSLGIATISLIWAGYTNRKLNRQQRLINENELKKIANKEAEMKQALIVAKVYSQDNNYRIVISNNGKGTARDIRFQSKDIEKENSGIMLLCKDEELTRDLLYSGDNFTIYVVLTDGYINPLIKITWDDDYGKNRMREQILNFDN